MSTLRVRSSPDLQAKNQIWFRPTCWRDGPTRISCYYRLVLSALVGLFLGLKPQTYTNSLQGCIGKKFGSGRVLRRSIIYTDVFLAYIFITGQKLFSINKNRHNVALRQQQLYNSDVSLLSALSVFNNSHALLACFVYFLRFLTRLVWPVASYFELHCDINESLLCDFVVNHGLSFYLNFTLFC